MSNKLSDAWVSVIQMRTGRVPITHANVKLLKPFRISGNARGERTKWSNTFTHRQALSLPCAQRDANMCMYMLHDIHCSLPSPAFYRPLLPSTPRLYGLGHSKPFARMKAPGRCWRNMRRKQGRRGFENPRKILVWLLPAGPA